MQWLSSSRVRLGLVVNILYFLSLFTPSPPHTSAGAKSLAYERQDARPRAKTMAPAYVSLPPQAGPPKAETHYWKASDQLDVYLTSELLLVRRYDHALLLSPTFSTKALSPERPRSVLLHFTSFSHEQLYDKNTPFVITADREDVWHYGWWGSDEAPPGAKVLHSAALDGKGLVVETLGHDIPSDIFARIASARQVTFRLGFDVIELTPEQLNALRDMRRHLH